MQLRAEALEAHLAKSLAPLYVITSDEHLLALDLQFHLDRNTGQLSRTMDRGTRSINSSLNTILFNAFPTLLEVCLVGGILTYNLGLGYACVTTATVAAYTYFTIKVRTM